MPLLDSAALVAGGVEGPTTTIHFCGFGGSTEGALRARLQPQVAVNHSKAVLALHKRNYPGVEVDCSDLSHVHPSRYRGTDIYQASPACTSHSTAAGARKKQRRAQQDLFEACESAIDPRVEYAERSRATMMAVVDHSEYHRYPIVLVENVADAANWVLFPTFLDGMKRLGYRHQRILSVNAAFVAGTPQDRNRMHIVFAHEHAPTPNMDLCPPAPCPQCAEDVAAVQVFKPGSSLSKHVIVGEYGAQYLYRCPGCMTPVIPHFRSALNAIDFDIEAPTIAEVIEDRRKRGRDFETMLIRIRKGIEQYGGIVPMQLINNCTTHNGRTRSLYDVAFTQTGSNTNAILLPPLDCGEADLPDPSWADASDPRSFSNGLRGAERSRSAMIDPDRMAIARRLAAGTRAARGDLMQWRYRTLKPAERLRLQGFSPDHFVDGTYGQKHLAIGNSNPATVEGELAARAGAALRPDLYPAGIRPAA